jgi:AcrR family transcriptional regulator
MSVDRESEQSWEQGPSLLDRAVQRRLISRQESVVGEVRRMLDAGVELMRDGTRGGPPRVADIVAAAEASNDAFYRAFGSRDEFLAAIVDDGARRLLSYVRQQRDAADDPQEQIRRGLGAVLKQAADTDVARTTRAVLSCVPMVRRPRGLGESDLSLELGRLLEPPLRMLGSAQPERDGRTLAMVAVGEMERFLWQETKPSKTDLDYLVDLARRMTEAPPSRSSRAAAKRPARRPA